MERREQTTRKPPVPSDGHAEIDQWIARVMPDLHPLVVRLDELVREAIPGLQYAIKWKKAYYGLPDLGWLVEIVAYDVSVNVVFLGGAAFSAPPPLGTGASRYVKLRSAEEAEAPELRAWMEEAGRTPGWR